MLGSFLRQIWETQVKCCRNQMSPSIRTYYFYLCNLNVSLLISLTQENVILTLGSLEIPKQLIVLPTAIFGTDANSIFSDPPSLAHSLSLRQLACFPFFPFEYKTMLLRKQKFISYLTINVCGPTNKLSHFITLLTIQIMKLVILSSAEASY